MSKRLFFPLIRKTVSAPVEAVYSDVATQFFADYTPSTSDVGGLGWKIDILTGQTPDGINSSITRRMWFMFDFNTTHNMVFYWQIFDLDLTKTVGLQWPDNGSYGIGLPYKISLVEKGQAIDSAGHTLEFSGDELSPLTMYFDNGSNYYTGGGHGHPSVVLAWDTPSHGKTYNDIGSSWTDANGNIWYIVAVMNSYEVTLISANTSQVGGVAIKGLSDIGGSLTHTGDPALPATNTATMSGWGNTYTRTSERRGMTLNPLQGLNFIVDGAPIDFNNNGTGGAFSTFSITQKLTWLDPFSVPAGYIARRPFTTIPTATGNPEHTLYQVYDFQPGINVTCYYGIEWHVGNKDMGYLNGYQHEWLGALDSNGDPYSDALTTTVRYIPDLSPFSEIGQTYDFRTGENLRVKPITEHTFLPAESDTDKPIKRMYEVIGSSVDGDNFTIVKNFGYTKAYDVVDSWGTNGSWWQRANGKSIARLWIRPAGNPLPAGTELRSAFFRSWAPAPVGTELNKLDVPVGPNTYIIRDYDAVGTYSLTVPAGKTFVLDNKSTNVALSGNTGTITITVSAATPMVGFLEGHY